MKKIDKHFVSEIDKKLAAFDAAHPKSPVQQAEFDKYQRLYQQRDVPTDEVLSNDELWR